MRLRQLCAAALCGLFLAPFGLAQTTDTATIRGHVSDPSHAAVVGAEVAVRNAATGAVRSVTTDAQGNYALAGLPVAGTYTLTAHHPGFAPVTIADLTLIGGATATIDLPLGVQGSASEITVTGAVGEVRADQPQLGDRLDARQIEATPLLGNQITSLPLLNSANRPAINMGDLFTNQTLITTGGSGRRQTSFAVDGANGNDSWGRQTIFTAIPADAVQEMTVLENAFSAQYGATTGGVVNIVTKSGTDQLHGSGEYTLRPNGTAASLSGLPSTSAAAHPTNDIFNQGDWSLSGPAGQHTQFALAGEVSARRRASPVISPLAPGNFIGQYRGGLFYGRLDHQFTSNHSVFLRGDIDSFYDTNPNGSVGGNTLPSTDRVFKRRTYSAVGGDTFVISPTMVNALRLQFQLASPITQFDPVNNSTAFVVPIVGVQTFTSGTSQSALLLNRQYEVADTLEATWGRHSVQFGADAILSRNGGNSQEFGGPAYLGSFTFNPCDPAAPGQSVAFCESPAYTGNIANVASFTQSFGNGAYTVNDTLGALFVQDDFHLQSNLTVNLGLRYERQTFTQADKDFAPRVGFAYSPWSDTVVRGGYGIYYSQIHDNAEASYALAGPTGFFNFTVAPGQPGFPATVAPWASFPTGANTPRLSLFLRPGFASYYNQFLPTSVLEGYPAGLLNPYSEQWTLGLEHSFPRNWVLSADYIGSHTLRIDRPLDIDAPPAFTRTAQGQTRSAAAANAGRPLWIYDASIGVTPKYDVVDTTVNDGIAWYDALEVNLNHKFSHHLQALASYTWSHALDTVDPDATGQSPNDPAVTGLQEKGNALFDQRQRFVLSGLYTAPFQISFGGVATLASGLAYNIVTGSTNGGNNRQETDRPVVDGVVIARNTGRGTPIYSVDPFVERPFALGEHMSLRLRAEAFNLFNHANFVGFNGTYGNGATPPATLGMPNFGISSQLTPRELQLSIRLSF